jgi:MATE family multidrug resistance protein
VLAYLVAIRLDPLLHRYHVLGFFWRPDWQRFAEILRIGTPIALAIFAEAGIFGAAAFLMGMFSPAQLAGHTLALQIAALAFQVPFGVAQAVTIRVGYFFGSGDMAGVRIAGWTGIAMGTGFMLLTAALMLSAPLTLLSLYVDPAAPANAALIGYAGTFLLVAAAFQLSDGLQVVTAGALRGLKDTRVPMWMAIVSYWGPGFGLAVLLGFTLGLEGLGVWIGLASGLTCAALLMLSRWHGRERLGLVRPV